MARTFFLALFSIIFFLGARPVAAQNIPDFPACPNPGGELIASYDSGIHGVPGDATEYTGSDKVFKLNDAQIVQCLCPPEGEGIQTLWWKDPGLTEDEESVVIKKGWIRIPDGSRWGLDSGKYYAKNSKFSCNGGPGNGGSSNGKDDDDDDGDDNGSSNGSSTSRSNGDSSGRGGSILGATTLAATGSWRSIIAAFAVATLAFAMARKLRRELR